MKVHELKCWPEYFEAVRAGLKPFEVRKADRAFTEGDILWLREWAEGDPGQRYTGRHLRRRVTYVLVGGQFGIAAGYVVLGLSRD